MSENPFGIVTTPSGAQTNRNIETATGKVFDFDNPIFDIEDMSYSLSKMPRYTGHTKEFYPVAMHLVLASYLADENKREAFMHDGHEGYYLDMSSPLKARLPCYKVEETKGYVAMMRQFGLPEQTSHDTHRADMEALIIEADALMPSRGRNYAVYERYKYALDKGFKPLIVKDHHEARAIYLARYHELFG